MRKIFFYSCFLLFIGCSWVDTSNDYNDSTDFEDEIQAINQTQTILSHVTGITKIAFGFVINEIGLHENFRDETLEIRNEPCPITTKEVDVIKEELNQFGSTSFDMIFLPACDINGRFVPYEGILNIHLIGDICAPEGEMLITLKNGFTVYQSEERRMIYKGGKMNFVYTNTENSKLFFKTDVDSLEVQENSNQEELLLNLINLDEALSIVDIGEIITDVSNPISFFDDTAEIRFSGGLLKRNSANGGVRADAHFNPSNLVFNLFCGCPIDGRLSLDISITEFIVDYSPKINDCDESPLNTIISNGQIVIENEPLVDTFLPCDGF